MFNKGDIVFYFGKNGRSKDRAKSGGHLWVILHTYTHPLRTVLMVPITSTEGYPATSVEIKKDIYSNILDHDSYLDFRSICVANTEDISEAKGVDINGKNTIILSERPYLKDVDIIRSDLAAMQALELGQTVQLLVGSESEKIVNNYKNDLNKEFVESSKRIISELEKIEDESVKNLIIAVIDNFKKILK